MEPLAEQLARQLEISRAKRTDGENRLVELAIRDLRASGAAERALGVGQPAPDFTLPNQLGQPVSEAGVRALGPYVLSFYRGGWWPYCNLQLRAYQSILPQIRAVGARLLAVSSQTPDNSLTTAEKNGLAFDVLSESGSELARAYGLVFRLPDSLRPYYDRIGVSLEQYNGDDSWQLPIPATYVVGQDGIVRFAYLDPDYTRRLEPAELLEVLRS